MKNQIFTLCFLLLAGISVFGQPKTAGEPKMVAKMDEPLRTPVWSPDGKQLALTSLKNYGIWIVSENGSNLRQVSSEAGAGYKMQWVDNQTVVPKSALRSNNNSLLQQMLDSPADVASNVENLKQFSGSLIYNPVASPKGDKIAFQTSGANGIFICNSDGSNIKNIGKGERANWTPDGKYVVVMQAEDNGMIITKSDLITIDVNSGSRNTLLSSEKYIAISPAVSPDGKKIAFEEYASGAIYVMDIK
jgi:Tol biopolymer transport system component